MDNIYHLLLTYRYAIYIPLAIFEGPIITVIAGFLVSLGFLDTFLVYIISVIGDLIGDGFFYSLGRWCKDWLHKYGFRFGLTEKRIDWAKKYFSDNQRKTLMLSKVVHGIGIAGLVTAGILNVPYSRFLKACLPISLIQSAILLLIGIFFGHAYKKIAQDLDYFAAATFALGAIALLIFWIQSRKKNKLK